MLRWLAVTIALLGCSREPAPVVRPAPEKNLPSSTVTTSAAVPTPAVAFDEVRCVYGGAVPAYFVWVEAATKARVRDLRAKTFEVQSPDAGWLNGSSGPIALRTRASKGGVGDVTPLPASLEPATALHLEVFGTLKLDVFGAGAGYPTEDRPFRVELVSTEGTFTLTGKCVVGPAG